MPRSYMPIMVALVNQLLPTGSSSEIQTDLMATQSAVCDLVWVWQSLECLLYVFTALEVKS